LTPQKIVNADDFRLKFTCHYFVIGGSSVDARFGDIDEHRNPSTTSVLSSPQTSPCQENFSLDHCNGLMLDIITLDLVTGNLHQNPECTVHMIQEYLRDIAGLVSEHCNKANSQ
jgi:hypothetical protein